ncbi:ABC transporter [Vallicoccus soli]|uniref:ABC transporter n=1 Tax=Vallicoccus soli TaxID=2339232 RepID=UPI001C49C220|nr:ABC transporter [Vallicoccus soli]
MTAGGQVREDPLEQALRGLREALGAVRLPLAVPGAEAALALRRELADQLDDYVLPRLARLDAPLLVVVGGSTGAGKSTLVNALVRADVTRPGVLRPTTREPVLVHHPDDAPWFAPGRLLPGLARTTGATGDPGSLQLVPTPAAPRGLALLDAPDVDSVVAENRRLAGQLLAAADLWLFLTTAARYADAVPWALLREAAARSAVVAVVLDRVPPEAATEVRAHLAGMLREEGLGRAPLFVVPEGGLASGRLPEDAVAPLRGWLHGLAADAPARAAVARATLDGVLRSYGRRAAPLVEALAAQEATGRDLGAAAAGAYADAVRAVDDAVRDGSLLRGEVLARWQDVVGTGDLLRGLQRRVGHLRDRVTAAATGRPAPEERLAEALESGVEALVLAQAASAAERAAGAWRRDPAGRALLAAAPGLDRPSPDLAERTARAVRDWQGAVLDLVRREGADRRRTARAVAYGVNGVALAVMVLVLASVGPLTGGEVAVAGGASALSQKLLEALLGDQAVRSLAARAREDLEERVAALLGQERERYDALLAQEGPPTSAEALRAALHAVAARTGAP